MNLVLLIFSIVSSGAAISDMKNQNSCKDGVCLSKYEKQERAINYKSSNSDDQQSFSFANLTSNLNERDIYLVPTSDLYLDPSGSKIKHSINFQEFIANKEDQVSSGSSESIYGSVPEEVEQHGSTDVTEISEFTKREFSSSTVEPNITESISTSTVKSEITTTEVPNTATHLNLLQYFKKGKEICFCDLQVNECDINCCCDGDCSPSHFKVFTKCIDNNVLYDPKYCYKSNFIFENNTYHKIVHKSGGLFCIVKENVEVDLKYETKEALTSLEAFNKSLPTKLYAFSYKSIGKVDFINAAYVAGSLIWAVKNGEFVPFKIPYSSVGLLCNAELNIQYLVDQVKVCFYHQQPESQCESTKVKEILHQLKGTKIISNPLFFNKSEVLNSTMICRSTKCIGITSYICLSIDNAPYCIKVLENSRGLGNKCWNALSHVQYKIWHNGTEGIVKMEAYLWVRKLVTVSGELLQLSSEVNYEWVGRSKKIFRRSGNPGYLTGKPILAGRKIYNTVNETSGKKEAIELSLNPKDWLSILGSEKGICSSTERIPINFRENGKYMCSLKLSRHNFSTENCVELQNNIFKLLIGNEIINETKENSFNKFVATFGNSRVEETGDWVQVLIDLFPISSSQAYFKPNHYHLMCKNMITDLHVYIIYSNIGSFSAPQAKILGVSFQFGKHKDLIFYCDTPGCERTALVRYFKLSSSVHFVDVTKPASDAFAEPLSLEIKLPHDFFYPFFSKSYKSQFLSKYVLILFLVTLF